VLKLTERYALDRTLLYRFARAAEEPSPVEVFAHFQDDNRFYVFAADNVSGRPYRGHGRVNKEDENIIWDHLTPPLPVQEVALTAAFGSERGQRIYAGITKLTTKTPGSDQ
jgi:hypothetical protein